MLAFLILIPVCLLWFLVLPPIAMVLWLALRLVIICLRLDDAKVPHWLDTPWDMLTTCAAAFFCVRVHDCDGQHSLLLPGIRSMRCAVLANHRSFGDFFVDPAMAHCAVMARIAAVAVACNAGIVGLLWSRVIMINRGKDSRQAIQQKTERYDRYLFYPEGTRRANHADADQPVPLKVGGLKNMYEAGRPALVSISVNKERIVNEKKGTISWGVVLYRARAGPIDPSDYSTFEAFHVAIEQAWQDAWQRAHAEREACEAASPARPQAKQELM